MVAFGAIAIVVGLAAVVVEAHVTTGGLLALAGVLAAAAGVGLIMAGSGAALVITVPVAVVLAASGGFAITRMARQVMLARRQPPRTGILALVGAVATVRTWSQEEGQVAADGTLWRAVLARGWQGAVPVPGDIVVVDAFDGLTVSVRRLPSPRA